MQQKHPLEAREVMTKIHRKNKTPSASRAFDLNFLRLGPMYPIASQVRRIQWNWQSVNYTNKFRIYQLAKDSLGWSFAQEVALQGTDSSWKLLTFR